MTEQPNRKYVQQEYRSRINRVIDYIESNIDRDLTLSELADVAGFSRYHFHRLFSAMQDETLNGFIQRIRLEKAASKLVQNPRKSITEIGLECGFSSSSGFARAFREKYGISATAWRSGGYRDFSKNRMAKSNPGTTSGNIRQVYLVTRRYNRDTNDYFWRVAMKNEGTLKVDVEVKEMPEMTVAYVRHIGPYKGDSSVFEGLFNRLMQWAGPRGLMSDPDTRIMSVYYDDPELTDDSKLRVDACVTVPADTEVDGEIGKTTIPAGKYAIGHFELGTDEYQNAWNSIFSGWLPESGYQPADGPSYEHYPGNMEAETEKHKVDIYIPVKPL